ncbi:MAG: FkbM family methyltransferase [Rhizobium sp.]|nr:FkbM family methyltransferase [Rhizobium sp.]
MARPSAAIPEFDDASPWGRYRPSPAIAARLALSHLMPPALAWATKALRKAVKYQVMTPLDLTIWGLKLRLLPRGNISEEKLYTAPQLFDREEFATIARLLQPGGVFVDVGANAGVYSFWAHHCMRGQGRIIAVEPDPEMARRITFNQRSNALVDIDLCQIALSDHEGMAEFYINPQQRGTNTLEVTEAKQTGGGRIATQVQLTTLLALLQSRGIASVDVLKMDIEGHEQTVLRHFLEFAPEALWPRAVISEFKDSTQDGILALLTARGYRRNETTKLNFIFERG